MWSKMPRNSYRGDEKRAHEGKTEVSAREQAEEVKQAPLLILLPGAHGCSKLPDPYIEMHNSRLTIEV